MSLWMELAITWDNCSNPLAKLNRGTLQFVHCIWGYPNLLQDPLETDQHQRFIFPSHSISTNKHTIPFWTSNFSSISALPQPFPHLPLGSHLLIKGLPQVNNRPTKTSPSFGWKFLISTDQASYCLCGSTSFVLPFSRGGFFSSQNKQFLGGFLFLGWKKTVEEYGNKI